MAMTLLQIIREHAKRSGVKSPVIAVSNPDPQVQQMVSLINEEIEEVSRRNVLQSCLQQFTFVTTAAEDQGTIESLFGEPVRYILNDILWNRTTRLKVYGPLSPGTWQQWQAVPVGGPLLSYRIRGDHMLFYPAPPVSETIAGEYVPVNLVQDATTPATRKKLYTKDGDTNLIVDDVLLAGLRWRWKREKGLPYAEDFRRYEAILADVTLRDGTKPTLRMDGGGGPPMGPGIFVPAGTWPLP